MSEIKICTDHKWKRFKYVEDVPKHVLEDRFKHLMDGETSAYEADGYLCYRKWWYHISDFMVLERGGGPLQGWHAYHGDSFFSGIVIKLHRDSGEYMVGTYMS